MHSVMTLTAALAITMAAPQQEVTFTRDVAPILQEKCQACHQPDSIAPFPLLTYDDARRVANLIKDRVSRRIMPPWHINRTVGIQEFKNDRGLSDEQIATIVAWVDAGAPEGDPADMPPPRQFPDPRQWQLAGQFGEPDLIVKSEPYTLAAETQDKWFRPVVETGVTEARWVKATEIKPSFPDGRRIVHPGQHRRQSHPRPVHGVGCRQDRRDLPRRRRQADAAGLAHPLGGAHARHRRGGRR